MSNHSKIFLVCGLILSGQVSNDPVVVSESEESQSEESQGEPRSKPRPNPKIHQKFRVILLLPSIESEINRTSTSSVVSVLSAVSAGVNAGLANLARGRGSDEEPAEASDSDQNIRIQRSAPPPHRAKNVKSYNEVVERKERVEARVAAGSLLRDACAADEEKFSVSTYRNYCNTVTKVEELKLDTEIPEVQEIGAKSAEAIQYWYDNLDDDQLVQVTAE